MIARCERAGEKVATIRYKGTPFHQLGEIFECYPTNQSINYFHKTASLQMFDNDLTTYCTKNKVFH